jgi:apolipoprotein N-acyltransferase
VVLAFGVVRLVGAGSGPSIRVGLVASDPPTSPQIAEAGAATAALLEAYAPFEPGTALSLLSQPLGTWGVQICKDMDFTPLSRDYGRAGVALMVVPAWDFGADGFLHSRMAVMRGVESGFGIVRAAKRGNLTVSDNRGRILAETPSDAAPFATLVARVPTVHADTLYQHLGDWFAWLAMAGLALAIGQLLRRRP